jgi:hypothetical protein
LSSLEFSSEQENSAGRRAISSGSTIQLNSMFGSYAHFWPNIAFSVNYLMALNSARSEAETGFSDSSFLRSTVELDHFGSLGLVWDSFLGSLGFFGGSYLSLDTDSTTTPFKFSFIPRLNAKDYPLLGVILNSMGGFLGIEDGKIKSCSFSLNSRSITFGAFSVKSIDMYHQTSPYTLDAMNRLYGAAVDLEFTGAGGKSTRLILEGGYRDFFDVTGIVKKGD